MVKIFQLKGDISQVSGSLYLTLSLSSSTQSPEVVFTYIYLFAPESSVGGLYLSLSVRQMVGNV